MRQHAAWAVVVDVPDHRDHKGDLRRAGGRRRGSDPVRRRPDCGRSPAPSPRHGEPNEHGPTPHLVPEPQPASRIGAGLADSGDRQQHADNGNQGSSIRITLPGRAEIGIRRSVVDVRVGQPCRMAQAFGALSVLLGGELDGRGGSWRGCARVGPDRGCHRGLCRGDFGDDDEFGELAGGGVGDVGEFAADSSRTRRPWSSVRVLVERRCRGAGCRCAAGR